MSSVLFRITSTVSVLALAVVFGSPVLAQDMPSGFPTPPSASEIQQMQQQAMDQAKQQAPSSAGPNLGATPGGEKFGVPGGAEGMQKKGQEAAERGAAQGAAGQLRGLQQGARSMEQGLKQFEALVKKAEQAGGGVSAEIKAKYNQLKTNIQKIKNAKSADEVSDIDTDSLQADINEVMESAGTAIQSVQQLKGLKQGLTGMERGLKAFEAQLARIAKQKVTVPAEIKDKVASIKTKIAGVKAAKTWDEAEAAGVEELQEQMESLNDYRDQLEVLMRLPMMQKAMDQQVNNLNKELKRVQGLVTKMKKQGIELDEDYNAFSGAIKALIGVRDAAVAKIKSGNSEEIKAALDDLEENFFGQISDAMEHSRVIQTMAGLSRFPAELKKNLASAQNQINQLKRKKVNTAELDSLLSQAKQKGNEVTNLIKVKPLDEDAVMDGIQALEDLRTQFEDKASELGGGASMPWETGPQQFKPISGVSDLDKLMPKQ